MIARKDKNYMRNRSRKVNEFWDPFDSKKQMRDKDDIRGIDMHPATESQCKIKMKGKNVVANDDFYQGDIIEIAPCKIMEDNYTISFIKDLVFELPDGKFALPFGYVQFYDLAKDEKKANCDYLYDPNMETIIIKATKPIKTGEKLALNGACVDEI